MRIRIGHASELWPVENNFKAELSQMAVRKIHTHTLGERRKEKGGAEF